MVDWGWWADGHLHRGHWFSHHFRLGDVGKEEWVPRPKWLSNNFGNKGFDKARGSEVELVLRKKKNWGQALHTQSHRDPRQVIKKTRWQKQHANHRSSRDGEVLGNATRGAAERHSPGPVRLTARWPLTLRGCTHRWESGARLEQAQALEHTEASL